MCPKDIYHHHITKSLNHHFPSPLHPRQSRPLDKIPLGEEEQHYNRQRHDQARSHGQGGIIVDLHGKGVEAEGERVQPLIGDVNERPHEVVPGGHEGKDSDGRQAGFDQREDDMPVDTQKTATVDPGGVFQISRDALHELPQEKDEKGVAERMTAPQREQCIVCAQGFPDKKMRNHGDLRRDHHSSQHQHKANLPTRPL